MTAMSTMLVADVGPSMTRDAAKKSANRDSKEQETGFEQVLLEQSHPEEEPQVMAGGKDATVEDARATLPGEEMAAPGAMVIAGEAPPLQVSGSQQQAGMPRASDGEEPSLHVSGTRKQAEMLGASAGEEPPPRVSGTAKRSAGKASAGRGQGRDGGKLPEPLPQHPEQLGEAVDARLVPPAHRRQAMPVIAPQAKGRARGSGMVARAMEASPPGGDAPAAMAGAGKSDTEVKVPGDALSGKLTGGGGNGGSPVVERLRQARDVRAEAAPVEERMPFKVVSLSTTRYMEPAGMAQMNGRDGTWSGAAAQVLQAVEENMMPGSLAAALGKGAAAPKVVRNLEIQLHPASLGTVTARLAIDNGKMEITISVPDGRLAEEMKRGLDHLVRRIRTREHAGAQVTVHVVSEAQNQVAERFHQQMPGPSQPDNRQLPSGHAREGASGGNHGGQPEHGGAQAGDRRRAGHERAADPDDIHRSARNGGLLYL